MAEVDVDQLLKEHEDRLVAELAELTAPVENPGGISFGKRVGDGTSIAVDRLSAVAAQEHLLALLESVRRARRRLEAGGYGRCEVCDKPIPDARLEVLPWATRCVVHQ